MSNQPPELEQPNGMTEDNRISLKDPNRLIEEYRVALMNETDKRLELQAIVQELHIENQQLKADNQQLDDQLMTAPTNSK